MCIFYRAWLFRDILSVFVVLKKQVRDMKKGDVGMLQTR